jgi:hypothetical protein
MELFKEENMKKLEVFDFDGTLFRNPLDTAENRKKYEQATGIPWQIDKQKSQELTKKLGRFVPMRKGWYGKAETLMPPLVPDPVPAEMFIKPICDRFLESKYDGTCKTVLMTGRHAGIAHAVLRLCDQGGLLKVNKVTSKEGKAYYTIDDPHSDVWFSGQDGPNPKFVGPKPKEASTLEWKLWILEQYSKMYEEAEIEMWEDRDEHVEEFRKLLPALFSKVTVNHVKE